MIRDKIIIVEDDPGISKYLQAALRSHEYDTLLAPDGKTALEMIASHCPDLLLLDLGLPDMDGSEIIRSVRSWSRMPIIIISARSAEIDKASALDMGADDYLTKPFGTVELLARIRTALRHTRTDGTSDGLAMTGEYHVGDLCIDYNKHRVFLAGEDTHLTPNEYKIVALLGRHAGQVLTYKSMMKELWGPGVGGDNKLLRVHMANIRRKIEPNPVEPQYIFTEVGVGYRMADCHCTEHKRHKAPGAIAPGAFRALPCVCPPCVAARETGACRNGVRFSNVGKKILARRCADEDLACDPGIICPARRSFCCGCLR